MTRGLTKEDRVVLADAIQELQRRMLEVFRHVPSNIILIFRNVNIIRCVQGERFNYFKSEFPTLEVWQLHVCQFDQELVT